MGEAGGGAGACTAGVQPGGLLCGRVLHADPTVGPRKGSVITKQAESTVQGSSGSGKVTLSWCSRQTLRRPTTLPPRPWTVPSP